MTSKGKPKRLGGEFFKSVETIKPRKKEVRDKSGKVIREVDDPVSKEVLRLSGESYRVDLPTETKRELFLIEVEKLEPEVKQQCGAGVLESLQCNVLPLYQADDYPGYQAALTAWQGRWSLDAAWVRDAALTTLQEWQDNNYEPGFFRDNPLEWQMPLAEPTVYSSSFITAEELLRVMPKRLYYDPYTMNRAEAKERFETSLKQLERRFNAFLNAQDKAAEKAGDKRTVETRQLDKFCWLARSRVLGWEEKDILYRQMRKDNLLAERLRRRSIKNQLDRQQTRNDRYLSLKKDYHRRPDDFKDADVYNDEAVSKSNARLAKEIGLP